MRARPALLVCAVTLHFLDIGAASRPDAETIRQTSTNPAAEREAQVPARVEFWEDLAQPRTPDA